MVLLEGDEDIGPRWPSAPTITMFGSVLMEAKKPHGPWDPHVAVRVISRREVFLVTQTHPGDIEQ